MLIAELLDKYHREVVPKLGERTQYDYAWHIARLKKHFGHIDVKALRPQDVGQFLDHPTGKISRNRTIAVLSACYTKAVGRWWLADVNPCLKVERNETHARTRYITDAEFEVMRSLSPDRIRTIMEAALLTGQRQGDLLDLRWSQCGPDGVFFQQGKTGKKLIVDLTPALKEVLVRARRQHPWWSPCEFVFRNTDSTRYTSEGFRANWQRYMRIALQRGLLKLRYTFHDIRAKCVSDTKDLQDAMNRAGHTSMAMTRGVYDRAARRVPALR